MYEIQAIVYSVGEGSEVVVISDSDLYYHCTREIAERIEHVEGQTYRAFWPDGTFSDYLTVFKVDKALLN